MRISQHQISQQHIKNRLDRPSEVLHPSDIKRIVREVRKGGIHTIPNAVAIQWGIPVGKAKQLIKQYTL
jgi:hypothetical protein